MVGVERHYGLPEILNFHQLEEQWRNLIVAIDEIENIFKIPLDIEFAVNKNNEVIIFQARPLVANFLEY